MNTAGQSAGQTAPAVARAFRVVERLAAAGEPSSLSVLSRELGIGPSSLLTVLAPLRDAGVVVRDAAGRYALGPALVGLGEAAARACSAAQLFERIAGPLVDRTGESVLLWSACGGGFALAAVREGRHALRFVPTVGLRLAGPLSRLAGPDDADGPVEGELLPGVWMVAVPLTAEGGAPTSALAVAGPTGRMRGESVRAALREAVAEVTSERKASGLPPERSARPSAGARARRGAKVVAAPVGRAAQAGDASMPDATPSRPAADWERAGPIEREELDAFLRQSHVATLSYVADDGYPATVPLWYAWDGTAFWLAPRPGAEWAAHVRLDPRVSLAVSESAPPLRRVLARGRLVAVDDPDAGQARDVAADLAARYAGCGAARPTDTTTGPLLQLLPERLIAWRGLLRHPRVAPESEVAEGHAVRRQLG